MKTITYTNCLLAFVFLCFAQGLKAQDIHHSQFYNAPLHLSPALTGVFDGQTRVMGNFRDQWYQVPITYRTAWAGVDTKFKTKPGSSGFFSGGLIFNFDHAGDSKMGTGQLALNGAYTRKMAKEHFLTAGLQVSGYQRSFRTDDLTFDEQYTGKQFEADQFNGEAFPDQSILYADFGVGLNWRFDRQKTRTHVDFGAGLMHINQPNKSFFNEDDIVLPRRFSIYGLGVFQLTEKVDLAVNAIGQYQGPYTENVLFAGARYHLNTTPTKETALQLGFGYRFNGDGIGTGDAFYPALEFHKQNWLFGLSYDINVSDFKVATGNLGGPELSVIYVFRNAPAVDICPNCPTYL